MNMNSLKIPDNGVMLKGSAGKDTAPLPPQAFAISLSDDVINGMIRCVQNGQDLQLALGANPTLHYGPKSHRISRPSDSTTPLDLYITKPFESTREAYELPLTMSIFHKPSAQAKSAKAKQTAGVPVEKVPQESKPKPKASQSSAASSSSNQDSDIEALRNNLAAHDAAKGRSVMVAGLSSGRKAGPKPKGILNGNGTNSRAMSTSPAIKPGASQSPNPLSASELSMERAKQQRKILVHELAFQDQTREYLEDKFDGAPQDFDNVLGKVATTDPDTKKLTLRKQFWRELDPWVYPYENDENRQQVIEGAIRQFDKQRLSASEKDWQKLLPKDQRNKGICLSRLQDKLAKVPPPPPPKIKLSKAEDSSTSKDDGDVLSEKPRIGGESMARSSSNPLPKSKKLTGSQAQAKRLLGNGKAKTAAQKVSPTKPKAAASAAKSNGARVLSQEFVLDSDSDGDETPLPKSKPVEPKPVAKPAPKPAYKPVERSAVTTKSKPVAREPMTRKVPSQPRPVTKRPRDEDDSSSSSGTPLSKRLKPKAPLPSKKPRPVDSRRDTPSYARKTTSPTKSSPLASSPPTNASDLSEEEPAPRSKKRKAGDGPVSTAKRQAIFAEVVSLSAKFQAFYSQYKALHYEISALEDPPRHKLADLTDMRSRLETMKAEIYKKHASTRA